MPVFDRGYRNNSRKELERKLKELEEKKKAARSAKEQKEYEDAVLAVSASIAFAASVELITAAQAFAYTERIKQIESLDTVPKEVGEVAMGFVKNESSEALSMKEYRAKIEENRRREKAQQAAEKAAEKSAQEQTGHSKPEDTEERQK